jgi:fucose 4-O-acetylase-like acetyltransferase
MEQKQSEIIEAMRFLLMILVLFGHLLPFDCMPVEIKLSSAGIYSILSEMISHNLDRIVVPCFFLFSGFFFFYKMKERWDFNFYWTQWKKRFRTLLIPYLIWNLLMVVAIILKDSVFHLFTLESNDRLFLLQASWFELLWSIPVNYPLWYLRDLICMVALTPLFFVFFRYTKIYGLLLLVAVYLLNCETNIPGFGSTAFLFFGSGAYIALNKKNILVTCSRFPKPIALASLFFLCLATYYSGTIYQGYILKIFVILGVPTAINITNKLLMRHETWKKILCRLSVSTLFIYAIHEIYIINWLKGGFYRTVLAPDKWGGILGYLLIPFICLFVCLALYFALYKIAPRLLSVLTGGRVLYRNDKEKI